MIPRLHISFPFKSQKQFWFGKVYSPQAGEYLLNHARSGIVMALRAALPNGGRVGVVAYNCHTVSNAVVQGGCIPVFMDVTEHLHIDVQYLSRLQLDALVLTNLFGIHNDIADIRKSVGNIPVIVDNAHGYGLPNEGDFTVYSINQGKFPALGEGGVLVVNNPQYQAHIKEQYEALKAYSMLQELKLYAIMLVKAIMHIPLIYTHITLPLKQQRKETSYYEKVVLKRMAKGVSRMYQQYKASNINEIESQLHNAERIKQSLQALPYMEEIWWGDNAFMAIVRCQDVVAVQQYMATQHGIETATHFAHAIDWAGEFGYTPGECPMAEQLTKKLVMIPTYAALLQLRLKAKEIDYE